MKKLFFILALLLCCTKIIAQHSLAFQHLNTSNGLSYLGVNDMCTDKKGYLWIATGNGLNVFNGKMVEKYFAAQYPQLQNNNIIHVTTDSSDNIWVLTAGGNVTMLDQKRKLHRVSIYKNDSLVKTAWILNTQNGNAVLWTKNGFYSFNKKPLALQPDSLTADHFTRFTINGFDKLGKPGFRQVFYYDDDNYLFVRNDAFYKVNFKTKTVDQKYVIPNCNALIKWGTNELLYSDIITHEIKSVNLATNEITYPFKNLKDQFGKPITAFFKFAEKINEFEYAFTSFTEGIYIYNAQTGKIYNYRHSFTDPTSISSNTQATLTVGKKGWVFINCPASGISYFNRNDFIGNQTVFADKKGNGFDGYVAGMVTKDNNTYYIGTAEGLLQWKRNTNTTAFINPAAKNGKPLLKKDEIPSLLLDKEGKLWMAARSAGIIVLDKNLRLVKQLKNITGDKSSLKLTVVSYLTSSPDGAVWASGANGICRINPRTFAIDNFQNTNLGALDSFYCIPLIFTDKNSLWVATTGAGVFHYRFDTQKMVGFNTKNGLINNGIFCINADSNKNIYVGTRTGLNILYTNGRIKTITQKQGLLIDRVEGLLLDSHNRMWIGNDIGLVCYNTADSSLQAFDERYGLSIYGFRVGSYFQMPNGEFFFGTPKGLQYFYPDSLFNKKIDFNVSINKIESKYFVSQLSGNEVIKLAPADNLVTFYFGTVDYSPHMRTYYQYKLIDIDKEWINVADQNSVRYNSLPPGKYIFKVRISNDNKNCQDAENEVTVIIATPFYKTWWFKLLGTLLGIVLILYVLNYYRNKQIEKRSILETELVITYFASQINSHRDTDALLWDVAKNCISKLHFEDCVIYLIDESRNVLVQKAAYGPKNPVDFTIHHPIEIPVGKGITGAVAKNGQAEIIHDTEKDNRYIMDDDKRYSEIAVPVFIDNKVVGIIDSEHHKKNFFTQKHLTILQTIVALCANQIQKTKAEEEKREVTIELLKNKQKAMESRLQSLRLQMNPHFLFNALNSVQQMILANEELVATKYLSRFSKLLRAILIHSDKETITLKEEIEILKMYVELESVRFKESFTYTIHCADEIETEEIKIPTLLIQPFVENAIWHGLMHKEGNRQLAISFTEQPEFLQCIIEDNGVGRKKASEIKGSVGGDKKHTGKGISVSEERLKTMKNGSGKPGTIQIDDLTNAAGEGTGTRVIINFPI